MRVVVSICIMLGLAGAAHADDAAAKALFDQGKTLFAEGRYGEACVKLEASYKMNQLSGTRGLLGACYEKLGRFASAWAAYRDSAVIADKQGNTERAAAARASAAELEPKLAWLTIDASAALATPRVKITIDGVEQPAGAFGSPIPIDAGQHLLAATATDYKPWKQTIDIADTEKQHASIPALVEDPTARLAEQSRKDAVHRVIHRRKLLAYGTAGAGVVALGVAAGLGVVARSEWNDAKAKGCDASGACPNVVGDIARAAGTKANFATGFGIAGLVAVGTGIAIYFTAPTEHAFNAPRVTPVIGPQGAALLLEGRF